MSSQSYVVSEQTIIHARLHQAFCLWSYILSLVIYAVMTSHTTSQPCRLGMSLRIITTTIGRYCTQEGVLCLSACLIA